MYSAVLGGLDERIWRFFVDHPFLTSFAKTYTRWGVVSVLTPLALAAGFVIFAKWRSLVLAVIPMISLQINDVVTAEAKSLFGIARPPRDRWLAGAGGGSFPSGHTANTTALVIAIALVLVSVVPHRRAQKIIYFVAGLIVSLMGWSRLVLNVHWFSDVVGGWLLGSTTAAVTVWAVMKLSRSAPTRRKHRSSVKIGA